MVLTVLLLLLFAPAAAGASEVRVFEVCPRSDDPCETEIRFQAAPGEVNDVELRHVGDGTSIADAGAVLTAGDGCVADGAHAAICERGVARVALGDGDDRSALLGAPRGGDAADGGDGSDRVSGFPTATGGVGADTVTGSRLTDFLAGGGGSDRLAGEDGDDVLSGDGDGDGYGEGEAPMADVLDGGPGSDAVSYSRSTAVSVDLSDPGPDGGPGEGDRLTRVEGAIGGYGSDTLVGDDRANRLVGGGGDDRIDCRGGDDHAEGGDDLLTGCERLTLEGLTGGLRITPARTRDGRLIFRLPCRAGLRRNRRRGSCAVVLTASQPGRRMVRRRRLPPGGGRVSVDVGVPEAPLRLTVRYPGSFEGGARAAWRVPEGGHAGR